MPKARRSRSRFTSDHDLLVVLVTNLEAATKTMASMQRTQQNLVGTSRALAGNVRDLTKQVNSANESLSAINAKLGIKILEDIEKRNVPHVNASEKNSTASSDEKLEKIGDPAETARKKNLDKLKDWVTKLGLVRSILLSVVTIIPAIGAVIFAVWKLLAWLRPDRVPPPPNPPMALPK